MQSINKKEYISSPSSSSSGSPVSTSKLGDLLSQVDKIMNDDILQKSQAYNFDFMSDESINSGYKWTKEVKKNEEQKEDNRDVQCSRY